jgi:hypothetical protein
MMGRQVGEAQLLLAATAQNLRKLVKLTARSTRAPNMA